jgi:arginine exporter protein ArgO
MFIPALAGNAATVLDTASVAIATATLRRSFMWYFSLGFVVVPD